MNSDPARFLTYSLILLIANIAGSSMMIAVGTLTGKPALAYMIGVVVLLFEFLLAGLLTNRKHLDSMGISWINYFSYLFFAFEGLLYNEMHGQSYQICKAGQCIPVTVRDVIKDTFGMSVEESTARTDTIVLFAYVLFFNIITFLLLKYHVKERR